MDLDALRTTRPIRTRVDTPDEINQVFDAIAYQKTAAVIRMVEGYVGAARYRDGDQRVPEEIRVRQRDRRGVLDDAGSGDEEAGRSHPVELHHAEQHAARDSRDAMRRRRHRARVVAAADFDGCAGSRPPGIFPSATSASATEKSQPAACALLSAQHVRRSEARRLLVVGLRERRQAAATTARRTEPTDLRALGEAVRQRPAHAGRADDASRRSLGARPARRTEHRGLSVACRVSS